jgi:hypothetical protein
MFSGPPHLQLPARSPFQRTQSNDPLPAGGSPSGHSSDWSEQNYFAASRLQSLDAGWLPYGSPPGPMPVPAPSAPARSASFAAGQTLLQPPPLPPPLRLSPVTSQLTEPVYTLTQSQLTQLVADLIVQDRAERPAPIAPPRCEIEMSRSEHQSALCFILKEAVENNYGREDAEHSAKLGMHHYEALCRKGPPANRLSEKIIILLGRAHRGACALAVFRRDCLDSFGRAVNSYVCNHTLNALVHSGLQIQAQSLLMEMPSLGQTPDVYSYNTLVFGAILADDWRNAEFFCNVARTAFPGPLHGILKKTLICGIRRSECSAFIRFAVRELTSCSNTPHGLGRSELKLLWQRLKIVSAPDAKKFALQHPEIFAPAYGATDEAQPGCP